MGCLHCAERLLGLDAGRRRRPLSPAHDGLGSQCAHSVLKCAHSVLTVCSQCAHRFPKRKGRRRIKRLLFCKNVAMEQRRRSTASGARAGEPAALGARGTCARFHTLSLLCHTVTTLSACAHTSAGPMAFVAMSCR
eukprot:5104792-Prymnesium_polylepis.1